MIVREMLQLVERLTMQVDSKLVFPDRPTLQKFLSFEIEHLSSREEWDFLTVHCNPIVALQTGKRTYPLPLDFGTNFVRAAENEWSGVEEDVYYVAKLVDDQTESFLKYHSPARFFGRNLTSEQNSRPTTYTIQVVNGGGSEIHLAPPPDQAYTIRGAYIPVSWRINDENELPRLPGNSSYLVNRLLAQIFRNTEFQVIWEQKAAQDLAALYLLYARNRRTRLRPGELRTYDIYAG